MRVGKTPQAILAAEKIAASRVLVVCPAIAVEHWRREWVRWAGCAATILDRGVWNPAGVVIASYDRATRMLDVLTARRWDVLIIDECHFAKNPEAQRTKAVFGKGGLMWAANRTWALSGTPMPKHAAELWPMMRAFGATDLEFLSFAQRYCHVDPQTGRIYGNKPAMVEELRIKLAPMMLRRTRAEVAPDMPAIDYQTLNLQVCGQPEYQVPAGLTDEQLADWLLANRTEAAETRTQIAMMKAGALAEEITTALEEGLLTQTVVFGYHIPPMLEMQRLLEAAGVSVGVITGSVPLSERTRVQDEFRRGGIAVVLAQIIAAGTAIDLSAARHGYFLELDWVPGNNEQAANRLVNMDMQDRVTIDVATWPGSIDDRVQRVLMRRARDVRQLF